MNRFGNKSYLKAVCLVILSFVFSSCGTISALLGSPDYADMEREFNMAYVGKTHANIVTTYGAPDRVESDGQGGQILVYEKITTKTSTDVDTHFGMFDPDYETTISTDKSYKHFFMDQDGICYMVKTNQSLPGGENDRKDKKLTKWTYIGSGIFTAVLASIALLTYLSH